MTVRTRDRIHDGWWCHIGEIAAPPGRGSSKAGGCGGVSDLVTEELPADARDQDNPVIAALLPGFEEMSHTIRPDSLGPGWAPVRLPHDWRIEQTPVPDGPIWQAFRPGGIAYYRRRFPADTYLGDRRVVLELDGVMRDATVWCNGFLLGQHLSGYTGVRFDVTELLRYDDEGDNILLVRCDTTTPEGWWYEGGGIYRDVWLTSIPDTHIDFDGIWITTPTITRDLAEVRAVVRLTTHTADPVAAGVRLTVLDPDGVPVAGDRSDVVVATPAPAEVVMTMPVPSPQLWEVGDPRRYRLLVEVEVDGVVVDRVTEAFGIRTIEFKGDRGLFVNGSHVRLQGANLHQDFAGLGIALPARVIEHKLRLLAEMGCNAVRTAHHPPGSALLEAADRLGLLVIAENRLLSTAPPYLADLEQLIVRGRNHPSVLLWSLENEEYLQATERGARILRTLVRHVRHLDPTRPVTVGAPRDFASAYFDEVDVVGTHYQSLNRRLDHVQALRPGTPHIADEEGLLPSVRGQYHDDHVRGLPSSFGTAMGLYGAFPQIMAHVTGEDAITYDHGATWQWFIDHPEAGGGFVWAGIDYLGEPTPMQWPVQVSNYGAMDLCGFPKDHYWLLRSFFRPEPLVHVLPHWTWPGSEGKPVRLWAYSNCEEVELVRNGVTVDRRPVVDHVARWDDGVRYEPGDLVARGLRAGTVVAEHAQATAGPPTRLRCDLATGDHLADGEDTAVIVVDVLDDEGRMCPWADDDIVFDVVGPAELVGVGNGDPASCEPHKGRRRRAFRGRALAVVRLQAGDGGIVELRASSECLQDGVVSLAATPPATTETQRP